MAKLNALVHQEIIEALYRASQAGVKIELNIRGICCLRPGVPGLSENISVISVVDRFLEHARLFYFHHGGESLVFISSADWMPRNLDRRVELLVPIEDPAAQARLTAILETSLQDSAKARRLLPDGSYERIKPPKGEAPLRSPGSFLSTSPPSRPTSPTKPLHGLPAPTPQRNRRAQPNRLFWSAPIPANGAFGERALPNDSGHLSCDVNFLAGRALRARRE